MPPKIITFRIPGPEEVLKAQGFTPQEIRKCLELIQEKYGPPDKLTPGEYTVELPEEALPRLFTNQDIITAIYKLAESKGENGWALLKRAGLTHLVQNRYDLYSGPPIEALTGLTPEERRLLAQILGISLPTIPEEIEAPPLVQAGPIPNYTPGRGGNPIDLIVIHYTASGSAEGTISWFKNPRARVSAHYLVGKDGTIYQLVRDEDTAWHAGIPPRPGLSEEENRKREERARVIRPNERGIGIEIVNWGPLRKTNGCFLTWNDYPYNGEAVQVGGGYWEPYADAQYESLIKLVRYLCRKHAIPPNYPPEGPGNYHSDASQLASFRGILGHCALDNTKVDPGPHFDWEKLAEGLSG
jgi:N-acetylmuramoyl-L-alanine amidase